METGDLERLKLKTTEFLLRKFPSGSFLVKLSHPESPNPVIYFEAEAGGDFAQGRFGANNEWLMPTKQEARRIEQVDIIVNELGPLVLTAASPATVGRIIKGPKSGGARRNMPRTGTSTTSEGNPQNVANGPALRRQLASDSQVAQLRAGKGEVMAGPGSGKAVKDEPRLIATYGGKPGDWVKIRSFSEKIGKEPAFESMRIRMLRLVRSSK